MVVNCFAKPKYRKVPVGDLFEAQYRENKGSKVQEISLMQKSINWFMNEMVVKKRDTRSTADFSPLVNLQVPSKIRKLVNIVHMFEKK